MDIWLRILIGAVAAAAGVLLRPYLLTQWGPYAFIAGVGLAISIAAGWRGKGKPIKVRFGAICGIGFALALLVTFHTNAYAGIAMIGGMIYLGFKTGFFDRGLGT